jgi:hypothetical protein
VVTEEVVETNDATILEIKTAYTVSDPDTLRTKSPRFKRTQKIAKGKLTRKGLAKSQRSAFDAYKAEVLKKSAKHPLRKAAEEGDQALLDAIASGKGDFVVTRTYIIPKRQATRDAKGNLVVPVVDADGTVDFSKTKVVETPFGAHAAAGDDNDREEDAGPPTTTTSGTSTHTAKFLTGFTVGDAYDWVERIDFPTGFFRLQVHADWSVGLRVPFEVKTTMDPKRIKTRGDHDKKKKYKVELSLKTLDAGASYYRNVGVDEQFVKAGQELVLEGGFWVKVKAKVLGKVILDRKLGGASFSKGQDFNPPFGDCKDCGPELWLPRDATGTGINLGIISGGAQLGVQVTGDSRVGVEYESLFGNDEVKSTHAGTTRKKHHLWWERPATKKVTTELKAMKNRHEKQYGFRLSDPTYKWDVALRPGVKIGFEIDLGVWKNDYDVGTIWLPVEIPLGEVTLDGHAGTTKKYKVKRGTKTWKR